MAIFDAFLDAYRAKRSLDNQELQLRQEEARWRAANELSRDLMKQQGAFQERQFGLQGEQLDLARTDLAMRDSQFDRDIKSRERIHKEQMLGNENVARLYSEPGRIGAQTNAANAEQRRALVDEAVKLERRQREYNEEISRAMASGVSGDALHGLIARSPDPYATQMQWLPLMMTRNAADIAKNTRAGLRVYPQFLGIDLPFDPIEVDANGPWSRMLSSILLPGLKPRTETIPDINPDNIRRRELQREYETMLYQTPLADPKNMRGSYIQNLVDYYDAGGQ